MMLANQSKAIYIFKFKGSAPNLKAHAHMHVLT